MHEFHEKPIAFIQSKKDKFQAKIALCYDSEGDDDCIVFVKYTQPPTDTLEESQAHLNLIRDSVHATFPNPVPVDSNGVTWLSVIQNANSAT
jgi:hypothetical protein